MNKFWKEFFKWFASVVIVGAAAALVIWLLSMLKAFIVFIIWVAGIAAVAYAIYRVKLFIDKYLSKNEAANAPSDTTKKV